MAERVIARPKITLPRPQYEVVEELYCGDFEVLREDVEARGSPIVDQLCLEDFLEMLQRDAQRREGPGEATGQLTHKSQLGETEWQLNLTVPISNELGAILYDCFESFL